MVSRTEQIELAVVGAGPAGLSAAVAAAQYGTEVLLVDDKEAPGGQLVKQIHKFFGSKQHRAGVRGIQIGLDLLAEADRVGVRTLLGTKVWGVFPEHRLAAVRGDARLIIDAQRIVLATGASEKSVPFDGWTLPGVMGAGAAQTFINSHRIRLGTKAIIIGSGNVGLIVAYQLLQAGISVAAIVEAKSRIGGYLVHAAKVQRAGVPILTGYTIIEARGLDSVEQVVIAQVAEDMTVEPNTETIIDVDLVCIATGLIPAAELCWLAECQMVFMPDLGGYLPAHDNNQETSIPGLYIAGDLAGIEEASIAMDEGRLAGLAAAESLGHITPATATIEKGKMRRSLETLRQGPFGYTQFVAKSKLLSEIQ